MQSNPRLNSFSQATPHMHSSSADQGPVALSIISLTNSLNNSFFFHKVLAEEFVKSSISCALII